MSVGHSDARVESLQRLSPQRPRSKFYVWSTRDPITKTLTEWRLPRTPTPRSDENPINLPEPFLHQNYNHSSLHSVIYGSTTLESRVEYIFPAEPLTSVYEYTSRSPSPLRPNSPEGDYSLLEMTEVLKVISSSLVSERSLEYSFPQIFPPRQLFLERQHFTATEEPNPRRSPSPLPISLGGINPYIQTLGEVSALTNRDNSFDHSSESGGSEHSSILEGEDNVFDHGPDPEVGDNPFDDGLVESIACDEGFHIVSIRDTSSTHSQKVYVDLEKASRILQILFEETTKSEACGVCMIALGSKACIAGICGFRICPDCLIKWIVTNKTCPGCRGEYIHPDSRPKTY
jgi:hypothetical protein